MKTKHLIIAVCFAISLVTGCDTIVEQFPPFNETLTSQPTNTYTVEVVPVTDTPTFTQIPPSLTPTFTLTPTITDTPQDPTQNILGTIDALQLTLDAASAQIATLEAEKTSSSSSSGSSGSSSSSGSSNSNTATPSFSLPSNVRTVTIIHRANLRISKHTNAAGKPVMSMPKPRIVIEEGSIQYIYNKRVDADGDTVFYEIYDPDGHVTQVLYIRAVDIQIRTSIYNTQYGEIPEGVVFANPVDQATLRYIKDYNDSGTPIVKIMEPRVVITSDDGIWVYPKPIYTDGGRYYLEIYDPDGIVTTVLFARVIDINIPNALQQ
jgi:hypothetical protein